jgi:hypothetical protein
MSNARRTKKLSPEQIASNERIAKAQAEAQDALRSNCCPTCGRKVTRNLSITGWVQCSQFGAVGFRADANAAPCGWQGFTQ